MKSSIGSRIAAGAGVIAVLVILAVARPPLASKTYTMVETPPASAVDPAAANGNSAMAPPTTITGPTTASAAAVVRVRVLPGRAEWRADSTPLPSGVLASGRFMYTVGDNAVWQLVAHTTGITGHRVTPECTSLYPGAVVTTGQTVVAQDGTPIVMCLGVNGHSGGIFAARLLVEGGVPAGGEVQIDFTP